MNESDRFSLSRCHAKFNFVQFVIGDTPLLNETYIRMFMSINEVENLFYEKKNSFKTNFKAEIVGNFLNTHGQHLIIIIANHGQNVRSSMHCRTGVCYMLTVNHAWLVICYIEIGPIASSHVVYL